MKITILAAVIASAMTTSFVFVSLFAFMLWTGKIVKPEWIADIAVLTEQAQRTQKETSKHP